LGITASHEFAGDVEDIIFYSKGNPAPIVKQLDIDLPGKTSGDWFTDCENPIKF
jgi:hypothetical protein